MANTSNLSSFLTDVADAIREKKGIQDQIPAGNFDTEIKSIETGTKINNQNKDITKNGTYTADEGYTGLGTVIVNVPQTGDVPVKLFKTKEEMNSSTGNAKGDLALVYKNEQQNMTADMEVTAITFPETVTLPTAFTDSAFGILRAVDGSVMFSCNLSETSFNFTSLSDIGMIRASYTSEDGITYTRTSLQGDSGDLDNPVALPTTVKGDANNWNDNFGYFMQISTRAFEGIYTLDWKDLPAGCPTPTEVYNSLPDDQKSVVSVDKYAFYSLTYFRNNKNWKTYSYIFTPTSSHFADEDGFFDSDAAFVRVMFHDFDTSVSSEPENWEFGSVIINGHNDAYHSLANHKVDYYFTTFNIYADWNFSDDNILFQQTWKLAPTQLDAISDYVYKKSFYGKNGVESGTLAQNISNSFNDTNADIYSKIQLSYNNMEPRILTDSDKSIDDKIFIIPVKSDGTSLLDTSKVTDMGQMFYNCRNLTTIPLLNTSNVTDMSNMFNGCTNLTAIPLLNTSKVTNMRYMFYNCRNLTAIPLLNTSNVTDMSNMFISCSSLTTIPELDTSSATDMNAMFNDCSSLTTIPELDTSSATDMHYMFVGCSSLTTIPLLNTSNVTDMSNMFTGCSNLTTIPLLNTSKVTNMSGMFMGCSNLTTIPELNTSKVTNMAYMFNYCSSLTTIPELDTSSATNMNAMFGGCSNLTTIPQLDTSNVTDMSVMFNDCTNLSDDSLNIIMQMCINATSYANTKTLSTIGLTSEQADKCKTLSNYSAFTSAGWTTGY